MSLKNLKDSELNKLLDEVALDLNKAFGEVQNKLAKGEEVVAKDEDAPPSKAAEESSPIASEGSDAPPPADDGSAPAAPAPDAGAAPVDPAAEQGAALTPEALQAEYAKLPPEELQMHMQACQAAMAALGGGMGAPTPDAAPPAPEAAAPAPAAPAGAPLMQSEKKVAAETLSKSEAKESELAKAEISSLKEDVEILAKTLKQILETPVRKAITSISDLEKSEDKPSDEYKPLAPADFWAKLKEVSKRSDLKKSEKQLILDVYAKQVNPEVAAKHLAKLFKAE